ncbi:hypothetical protein GJ688_07445 [Heliobacillus mobilis]|uniref:Putative amidase domain-containing protein n=1 Tax=Heliobacterium mobile TaxID=28064 RepID=A0A6I3SIV2_HELMO|nr:amidase domain-containing protein [Heliobacterium mobile]MTV48814.1 hypothetical protein [Heliobacterium mobile]
MTIRLGELRDVLDEIIRNDVTFKTGKMNELRQWLAPLMAAEKSPFEERSRHTVAFILEKLIGEPQSHSRKELLEWYLHESLFFLSDSSLVQAVTAQLRCPQKSTPKLRAQVENYDRDAAVAYANRYYKNHNPAYPDFDDQPGEGGNCANFISQCLFAGGMPWIEGPLERYTWAQYWWCKPGATDRDGDRRITLTWKVTTAFRNHWSKRVSQYSLHSSQEIIQNWPRWWQVLERGDFIQLAYPNGAPYHTLMLVRKTENDWLLAAQTDDTNSQSMYGTIYAMQASGEKVHIYQMG